MKLEDFFYEAADGLRRGDYFDPKVVENAVDELLDHLEKACQKVENEGMPEGLEALEGAFIEAAQLFSEAADLLVLAVNEDVPELHSHVSARAQDAVDTLRMIRQSVELQNTMLVEEIRSVE